jgi:hydroxymethylpyrimidine pyrophosphatase-like HAD family hydrolase
MTTASNVPPRQLLLQQLSAPLPDHPELVLVTDLDGTLLGGSLAERCAFYGWLERRRHQVLHVFCTGRDLRSIDRLLAQDEDLGLRAPHLVIGDVGCTVACGTSLELLSTAVDPIRQRWQGKQGPLTALLHGAPGLSPQPISSERRLAYYYDPETFDHSLITQIEQHGVDCLLSDNQYLDVLPAGVNKGSTLLALLDMLDIEADRVVTAGDSLNDLAMFETGLAGVMVGNAEPDLLAALPRLQGIYLAQGHGCKGIVEGLRHFGFGHLLD